MDERKHDEGTFNTVLLRLRELTQEHKLVEQANDTINLLLAPLREQSEKALPTWDEHRQRVAALTAELPGFTVWWEPRHRTYVLVPSAEK